MNAVERMVEYTSQPTEGSAQALTQNPPQGWPHAGAIRIDNLQVSHISGTSACYNVDQKLFLDCRFWKQR